MFGVDAAQVQIVGDDEVMDKTLSSYLGKAVTDCWIYTHNSM